MKAMVTVFEITGWSNGIRAGALFDFAIGTGALILGTALLVRSWRSRTLSKGWPMVLFIIGWSLFWLVGDLPSLKLATVGIRDLIQAYRNGRAEVIEGVVHVSHRQPAWGHSAGDKITIGDKRFEVNFFLATPGYRRTISHGGALREGVFARLHHFRGVILKVEVDGRSAAETPR